MPLTPAWLRYQLLRMAKAGEGVSEVDGRFGLTPATPDVAVATEPSMEDEVDGMGIRLFWNRFVKEAYDVLLEHGPLRAGQVLDRIGPDWIAALRRYEADRAEARRRALAPSEARRTSWETMPE